LETSNKNIKRRSSKFREKLKRNYIDFRNISDQQIEDRLPTKGLYFQTFHSLPKSKEDHFKRILELYLKYFKFITYSQAVDKLSKGEIDGRYICISSDDGYKDFLQAARIFDSYDIKAMVFVNPGIIGESNIEVLTKHCNTKLGLELMKFLNWDDLEYLLSNGHEIGNHGMHHLNLTECDDHVLEVEIASSKELLESRLGRIKHYAWTFGLPNFITPQALKLIYSSGHESAAGVVRGFHCEAIKNIQTSHDYIKRDIFEADYSMKMIKYFLYKALNKS